MPAHMQNATTDFSSLQGLDSSLLYTSGVRSFGAKLDALPDVSPISQKNN